VLCTCHNVAVCGGKEYIRHTVDEKGMYEDLSKFVERGDWRDMV
jgi:hypothetical protein